LLCAKLDVCLCLCWGLASCWTKLISTVYFFSFFFTFLSDFALFASRSFACIFFHQFWSVYVSGFTSLTASTGLLQQQSKLIMQVTLMLFLLF
jgi:uncharacterized membrane protein